MPTEATLAALGALLALVLLSGAALAASGALHRRGLADETAIHTVAEQIAAWWTGATLLAGAHLIGREGVVVLAALVSFVALRELMTLTVKRRADHHALAASFFVVLPIQYWLVWIDWYGLFSIFVPVYAFLVLPILSVLRGDPDRFLIRVSESHWALMICVFALSHVPALLSLDLPRIAGGEILLIVFLVLVVQGADILRTLLGHGFGTRPLAPGVMPGSTWESAGVSIAAAAGLGVALFWMTPFGIMGAGAMAAMAAGIGLAGRLVMVAIRLDAAGRGRGSLLHDTGGVIDRIDSVVFAAPVFFHVTRFFWAMP